jgi:methylthioribose-1-phosphate isomerase
LPDQTTDRKRVTPSDEGQPPSAGAGQPPSAGERQPPSAGEAHPPSAGEGQPSPPVPDFERRQFFRRFAGEVLGTAATLVGAAQALQRSSADAAAAILNPAANTHDASPGEEPPARQPPTGFRTPFRFADEERRVLLLIDQRRLPDELVEIEIRSSADASRAIRDMAVRGAPAIGQVAALALGLTAEAARTARPHARRAMIRGAAAGLRNARPTAANLSWAVDRLLARFEEVGALSEDGGAVADALRDAADAIVTEATDDHGRLAEAGAAILPQVDGRPLRLLTHCNTGPLACGQFGTALGVVQVAHHAGRDVHVWVDETRPYLQGARLTAWELLQAGVPHTLIADVAAGAIIAAGEVDAILVGADRIAANGDTANKIGTYPLAVLAARHDVPFYVCAPLSSVDPATADGSGIRIEDRPPAEVLTVRGARIAPAGTAARNPAFDVTPAELITAIVTEEGVLRAPFGESIADAFLRREARRPPRTATADAAASAASAAARPVVVNG